MSQPSVLISLAAEFVGKKAFKQADTATEKMTKNVKKLAGALGLAFGGQQILAYGKKAIKAAAEDEKAQKQLALALKNVGLSRDAASSEDYIQRLQSEFGILDDKLRPAYQTLAVATRDTEKAQRLLNLSLDISAATGKDLSGVTGALSKAYLGNNTALSKLGVGISKADLKAGKFEDIIAQLETTFKGAATQSANTFQGSIDKLGVAAANASEIIGTGLIDALKGLGDQDSVDNLASAMEKTAIYIADVIRGVGILTEKLKGLPGVSGLNVGMIPILGTYLEILRSMGKVAAGSGIDAQGLAHLAELQSRYAIETLAAKKKLTAEEKKALATAKLKAAIDKANLALNKGSDVFDMDKIQIAAALTNQAEQLGKATSAAQVLQIANDTARLNVKRSILALEDAIASKDEASIVAATNKLNADLKVLGALSGQSAKLTDIKSILESLKPADLINLANLDAAIAKMMELLKLQGTKTLVPTSPTAPSVNAPSGGGGGGGSASYASVAAKEAYDAVTYFAQKATDAFQTVEDSGAFNALVNMYAGGAINPFNAGSFRAAEGGSMFNSGAVGSRDINITVTAPPFTDPNAIAEAIDNVLREARDRGTLTIA